MRSKGTICDTATRFVHAHVCVNVNCLESHPFILLVSLIKAFHKNMYILPLLWYLSSTGYKEHDQQLNVYLFAHCLQHLDSDEDFFEPHKATTSHMDSHWKSEDLNSEPNCLKLGAHGTRQIFDWLKQLLLTRHVLTKPFNSFALLTQNWGPLSATLPNPKYSHG